VLAGLAPELRCTACGADRSLLLDAREEDEREVRAGTLECVRCATRFAVADGVAELMAEAPEPVAREAAGLERFAEVIARRRLGSPAHPAPARGAERLQRTAFEQLWRTVSPERGARLLGVGSNTCWASNLFARRGLSVVAVDIALTEMQGLRTADWFLDDGCPHFERVLGSMFNLPFAGESLDTLLAPIGGPGASSASLRCPPTGSRGRRVVAILAPAVTRPTSSGRGPFVIT